MDQDALAAAGTADVVEVLVGGQVVDDQADRLSRVDSVRDGNELALRQAEVLGVGTADAEGQVPATTI